MLWRRTTPWKSGEDGSNEQGYVPCENDPEPHCGIGYSHELLWQRDSGDSDIARKLARQFIVDCSDESMNVTVPSISRSESTDSLLRGKDEMSCRMLFPAPR